MKKLRKITTVPRRVFKAIVLEGLETTQMVKVFARQGGCKLRITPEHHSPTEQELREALEQLKDIPRFLPFFIVALLPVPGIVEGYALLALILERLLGDRLRLLPSQFRHLLQPEQVVNDRLEVC